MAYMAAAYIMGGLILGLSLAFALGWWWDRAARVEARPRRSFRIRITGRVDGKVYFDCTSDVLAAYLERLSSYCPSMLVGGDVDVYAELIRDSVPVQPVSLN